MGGDADGDTGRTQLLHLPQVVGRRGLAEAVQAAAAVRGEKDDERDSRLVGRLGRGECLLEAEVVELADGGVPGGEQLAVDENVLLPYERGRLAAGLGEHLLAPRPEVTAARATAERALECVTVRVDETGQRQRVAHAANRHSSGTDTRVATR